MPKLLGNFGISENSRVNKNMHVVGQREGVYWYT